MKHKQAKNRAVKAWAVINGKEIQCWWTGRRPNQTLQYDIFYSRLGAEQAKKEWGFPASIVPVQILLPKQTKK